MLLSHLGCCLMSQCVSRCCPTTLGSTLIPRFYALKTCSSPTKSYSICRRPFPSSFDSKGKTHYCASILYKSFAASGRRKTLLWYEGTFTMQVSIQGDQLYVCNQIDDRKGYAYLGPKKNTFLGFDSNRFLSSPQLSPYSHSRGTKVPADLERKLYRYHQSKLLKHTVREIMGVCLE